MNDNDHRTTRDALNYGEFKQRPGHGFRFFSIPYDQPIRRVLIHGALWGLLGASIGGGVVFGILGLHDAQAPAQHRQVAVTPAPAPAPIAVPVAPVVAKPIKPVEFYIESPKHKPRRVLAKDGCTYMDFTDDSGLTRHVLVDAVDDQGQPVEGDIYAMCPAEQP